MSHSHDLLDVNRFDFFINEHGIMEKEAFMAQYMDDGDPDQDKRRAAVP